jgi:small-conductance mechanosensitive channel
MQSLFSNATFIFGVHPYDIGDRIYIFSDHYVVKSISLFNTVRLSLHDTTTTTTRTTTTMMMIVCMR